jgi:integrase
LLARHVVLFEDLMVATLAPACGNLPGQLRRGRSSAVPQSCRQTNGGVKLVKRGDYVDHDLVFATASGLPCEIHNVIDAFFKPALKAAKRSDELRLYDLRHTCATLLLVAGENPKVVSERLGHASVTLTLDTYFHVWPGMQESATKKLKSTLFAAAQHWR